MSVETPEHVMLRLELAGPGSRLAAGIYDLVVVIALYLLVLFAVGLTGIFGGTGSGWAVAVVLLLWFLITWTYHGLFEALGGGRTPGKRRVGIRVVMDTGHPITVQAAVARNLIRIVDGQPFPTYGVGFLFVVFRRDHRRPGDLVAGTIVVRDRPEDLAPAAVTADAAVPASADASLGAPPRLSDDEFRLLDQFVARLDDFDPPVRARLVAELSRRFGDRAAPGEARPEAFLIALHQDELARRRSRTAARRTTGGTPAGGTAERFVAVRRAVWVRFRQQAFALERSGLGTLDGHEVTRFARDYREVAADLARARTYGVDARVLAYLERMVGAGHNALYGLRGVRRVPVSRLLLRGLPAAAYRARAYVAAAALLFAVPAVIGWTIVREQPAIVHEILPDGMIARAEAGASERVEGRGYAQAPSPYLPLVASRIIANNVQVAFGAFAFGVTAGIGTVAVLAFNGLFFGAVLALFANYGLAGWLLTFVAGHGVLELTAIFIAGAAGLLVARAIVAPGDLTRRDALVSQGRWAVLLVGAAACLLLIAGTIEGFLSASGAPAAFKFGVSVASAVLVGLLFAAGRRAATVPPEGQASSSGAAGGS
jgi:uncharacterized membrane protein SpoIIM required for sporulation/uncharacterized RDD family membrane protein YckC